MTKITRQIDGGDGPHRFGGGPVLFLLPHQDDEVGIAPAIHQERAAGQTPFCVFLTDGGGNRSNPLQRNRESTGALKALGIPKEQLWFVGTEKQIPDGRLIEKIPFLRSIIRERFGTTPFKKIYVPAFEGGHPDHDAANFLAALLALDWKLTDAPWEFSLYHAFKAPRPFFRVFDLFPNGTPQRRVNFGFFQGLKFFFLIRFYPSQWKTWLGLSPQIAYRFLFHRSILIQPLRTQRLSSRPHPGPLLYERMGRMRYEEFQHSSSELQII